MQFARETMRELRHRIAEVREKVESIVARRPSPSGLVIPEVDAFGRLRDLYIAPGTCVRMDSAELAADIAAAIIESAEDARRKYYLVMHDPSTLSQSLEEVMRERRSRAGTVMTGTGEKSFDRADGKAE